MLIPHVGNQHSAALAPFTSRLPKYLIQIDLNRMASLRTMVSWNAGNSFEGEPSGLTGTRVLVVEDSWDVSAGLKALLEAWGAEVVGPAATADDARRLISGCIPDVALVDINLRHGERSYGLVDEMRELGVPVVLITGYANVPPVKDKAAAILQKPFDDRHLLATLRAVKGS
jgi:CheY-like chemotaxis protein